MRPEEIWGALRQVTAGELPPPVATRLRQGPLVGDEVAGRLEG